MMDAPPAWGRVKALIEAALERAPDDRGPFVRQQCGTDRALRDEVETLLAAMEQAGSFGERPAYHSLSSDSLADAVGLERERSLEPGDAVGPYQILGLVGRGGMGEVYRARDARLNRDIALKIPSDDFATDADRLARFEREAQVLASLNHPNIAAIYGLEDSGSRRALVLEFVEGISLARRIAEGPLPVDRALSAGRQIADGLSAAHRMGIVHRDLKPANVMVRPDGTVKILDFGLARPVAAASAVIAAPEGPSWAGPATTRSHPVYGTAAYMSPEQALGRSADARSDIWAFGCVVYECLTGRRAFPGETAQDALAAVLLHEPEWGALPTDVPASVVTLLRWCLEKDPERRCRDIATARLQIERAVSLSAVPRRRGHRLLYAVLAIAGIVAGGAALERARRVVPAAAPQVVRRLLIGLPSSLPLARAASMPLGDGQASLAVAPDGTRVAYVMERQNGRQLYLHELDRLDAVAIPRTDGAFGPFFSPDGQWIGFFADNRLKKVSVSGGDPIDLWPAPNPYGGSWAADGTILFAAAEGFRPTMIRDGGGASQPVHLKEFKGAWTHPHLLPGGKAAIVSRLGGVGVVMLDTGEYRTIVEDGGDGRYVPTGHLVFARAGALLAAPFDLERIRMSGPIATVLQGLRMEGQRLVAQAGFSDDGTLVYLPGRASIDATRPVWVDRRGKVEPVGMPPRSYRSMSVSPEGQRLAIVIADPRQDVWVQDLARGTLTRLTSGGENVQPHWTPDGTRVVFTRIADDGVRAPFWTRADGSGEPERMSGGAASFSPKGDVVAFARPSRGTGMDLWVRPLDGAPQLFLGTRFTEARPGFAPDGRWISYVSDESGQYEVYVRPYPGPGEKRQVSTHGGEEPIWSRGGKELFYRNGNAWMAVDVRLGHQFQAGTPRVLFRGPYLNVGGLSYDVTPDGQRFVVLEPVEPDTAPVTHLNVVLNWFAEVKQRTDAAGRGGAPTP
jgi:serine/threonine-protein kinase